MDWMTREIVANWKDLERHRNTGPVSIDYARLEEVMEEHTPKALATTAHLPPIPGVGSENPLVAVSYVLTGNIWNFHFKTPGEPPYRVANPGNPEKPLEGFMAFWHKLYQHFGERVITADMLRPHVESVDATREFFRDLTEIPLPELRQRCGLDFVRGLEECYEGSSFLILRDLETFRAYCAGHGLVEVLVKQFPIAYGEDHRIMNGRRYQFFKRARLVAILFHQYAVSSGQWLLRPLADIDELGPLMEYQILRILRALRVLRYSHELEDAIEQGREILRGSFAEVMMRSGGTAAMVYWAEGKKVPIWRLDPYLFSISRGLPNRAHYTKTSDY